MKFDIHSLIGEATAYDKKQQIEAKRPKIGSKVYLPLLMAKAARLYLALLMKTK